MAIILNKAAYIHANTIIKNGLEVEHDSNNWNAVKPTEDEVIRYLDSHTLSEYGNWFLAINTDADQKDPLKYMYPFGDLKVLHRSALIAIEREAGSKHHHEIKKAAQDLLNLMQSEKK
jgi:hypothetical protein